ncbi:IS481 family transposase [Pseudoalteromonas sp.]|uniref:IS481 family transposase n=1 Tax=Pseudoalteromonas sp. TaxID=53249 RepID=UPI002632C95A|nr:IS481 family transposase [Pseudoalteromonas sp.]MCP4588160.1 IS481 family transposase [Pseudoalteromonas sp.]
MTSDTQMYIDREHIIKYYLNNRISVTQLCKQFNRSRTWFYKWMRRYKQYGHEGLLAIKRKPPVQPNQTPLDIEMKILKLVEEQSAYGSTRITSELAYCGVNITPSAVYNVLKRHNLNTRKLRLEYIRIKHGIVKKVTDLDRARNLAKSNSLITRYPGHIIGMDVFYVGTLKGVGRIYQFTAIDTYSSYAWAKLYTDKQALSACDFMRHIQYNRQEVPIDSVLTDNGKEFTHHASKDHSFERMLVALRIKHRLTKVRHPWTNGACERLNRTILEEFYQVTFRKKIYETVEQLNDELEKYLEWYNYQRTHNGKRTRGRIPAELFLLHKKSA